MPQNFPYNILAEEQVPDSVCARACTRMRAHELMELVEWKGSGEIFQTMSLKTQLRKLKFKKLYEDHTSATISVLQFTAVLLSLVDMMKAIKAGDGFQSSCLDTYMTLELFPLPGMDMVIKNSLQKKTWYDNKNS